MEERAGSIWRSTPFGKCSCGQVINHSDSSAVDNKFCQTFQIYENIGTSSNMQHSAGWACMSDFFTNCHQDAQVFKHVLFKFIMLMESEE